MSALVPLLARRRTAAVLGLTVFYATCYVAIKDGLPYAPPLLCTVTEHLRTIAWTGVFVSVLLFLALVRAALSSAVWLWLVQEDELGRLTTFLFLVPILGLAIASIIDRETVALTEGAGVVLTIVGVAIATVTPAQRTPDLVTILTPELTADSGPPVRRSPPS